MTGFIKTVSIICVDKLLFAPIHPYFTLISHLLKSASIARLGREFFYTVFINPDIYIYTFIPRLSESPLHFFPGWL